MRDTPARNTTSVEIGGTTYRMSYAEDNFYFCQECNEWHEEEPVEVIVSETGGTNDMCEECAKETAFKCKEDDEFYLLKLAAPDSLQDDTETGWLASGTHIGNTRTDGT